MTGLKLAKLPDRTPVKVAVTLSPELNRGLQTYAELYREAYGTSESVAELIPYILKSFLESDRSFAKACKATGSSSVAAGSAPSRQMRPRGSGERAASFSTPA